MIQLQQILVATDFSEVSTVAVDYGRALARTFGGSLQLLYIMENPFLRPTAGDPHTIKTATLGHLFERLTDEDRTALHATAALEMSDDPAEEIVNYARTNAIDLIVLGTHLLLGSVAEKVVRTAPCPVLTVRCPEREFVTPMPSTSP
jgi:nucleotide-binding universal stress UspA family protein